METKNSAKVPLWKKLRNAKTRISALESSNQSLLREFEKQRALCDRLQAERDNWQKDCKVLQEQADKCNERVSRVLGMLEEAIAKNASPKTGLDFSGLDYHFMEMITLDESKQSVMEAASVLAMIPHTDGVDERAAYCHTIGQCLCEYTDLLNRIGGTEL